MRLILPRRGPLRPNAANKAPLLITVDQKDRLSYYEKSDDDAVDIHDIDPSCLEEDGLVNNVCSKNQHICILETLSASTSKMMTGTGTDKSKEEEQPDTIVIGHNTNITIDANQESKSSPSPSPPSPPTHERNGSHGTTSTATTKVAAHTTTSNAAKSTTKSSISTPNTADPNLQVNPKEEKHLDQLVRFIDTIMTGSVVETDTTSIEKEQQTQEAEPAHADSSPVITSDVRPKNQFESGCQVDEAHCDVADDDLTLTEENGVDFYFNEDLDDIVVSMVDDVSVSISVALSGILSSNKAHDNEEIGENEAAAKVPDQGVGKLRAVDEDADALVTTEIEDSRGIHHDSFGNTEIFYLEASKVPFQLSYISGNTELILIQQKNEGKFFPFPISKGISSVKMIGDRLTRSTRSSKRNGVDSTALMSPQASSSEPLTTPPPLDDLSSTGSEPTDDESTTSETTEEDGEEFQEDVHLLLKSLRSDISSMTRDIIFPNKENEHEGGDHLVKDEPSVSKAVADIVMQVNRDAYDGLIALCADAMNPQGTSGSTPSPTTTANVQKKERVPEVPAKLRSTIQLVASDLTDASAYSADLFSRD